MEQKELDKLVEMIKRKLEEVNRIPIEASGRHIHLSESDAEELFGKNYKFNVLKDLSQPGQVAYKERVKLVGDKGVIDGVIVLGPCREKTQVELSATDCKTLGIKRVLKESGDTEETPGIFVVRGEKIIRLKEGVIVAKRHIHLSEEDAEKFKVKNKEKVKVRIHSERPIIFDDVVIRVSSKFRLSMHIDYDEANACFLTKDSYGMIEK